mgnify:FL=1
MPQRTAHSDSFKHIIGQGFAVDVQKALNNKQKLMAIKGDAHNQYFNNNSPWIKLASSVRVLADNNGKNKLINAGLPPNSFLGNKLSTNFYLFSEMKAGQAVETSVVDNITALRNSGMDLPPMMTDEYLDKKIANASPDEIAFTRFYSSGKNAGIAGRQGGSFSSAYGFGDLEFGIRPLPGITDLQIETLGNNGSLRKATLKIKAFNKMQFNIIELLYLRLGFHVLVEFGNRLYIKNNLSVGNVGTTLMEQKWFGDENFVDLNDPGLIGIGQQIAELNEDIIVQGANLERAQSEFDAAENLRRNASDAIDASYKKDYQYALRYAQEMAAGEGHHRLLYNHSDSDEKRSADLIEYLEMELEMKIENDWRESSINYTKRQLEAAQEYNTLLAQERKNEEEAKIEAEKLEEAQEAINNLSSQIQELQEDIGAEINDYLDDLNKDINSLRKTYNYDYDGFIGRVTNFDWNIDTNGVYNITVEVFSAGDVLQSLTVNGKNSIVGPFESQSDLDGSNPLNVTKDSSDLVTGLNNLATLARGYTVQDEEEFVRSTLSAYTLRSLTGDTQEGDPSVNLAEDTTQGSIEQANLIAKQPGSSETNYMNGYAAIGGTDAKRSPILYTNRIQTIIKIIGGSREEQFGELGATSGGGFYSSGKGFEVVKVKSNGNGVASNSFFITLKFYLQLIQAVCLPKSTPHGSLGTPFIRILTERGKYLFTSHNMLASSKPSICVVATEFDIGSLLDSAGGKLFVPPSSPKALSILSDKGSGKNFFADYRVIKNDVVYGDIMNIYLNMDFLAKSLLDEDTDDLGNVNFLQHISRICKGINDSFGNTTQIDFKVDEDRNVCYFVDKKSLPNLNGLLSEANKPTNPYIFNINGFANAQGLGLVGNIVRNFNLKSTIPPDLATLITIGANQAGSGATGGFDGTSFSKWNSGLSDRVVPTRFIEGFNPTTGNLATIQKRNKIYIEYLSALEKLYNVQLDDQKEVDVTVSYKSFLWIEWGHEVSAIDIDTDKNIYQGVNLNAEAGVSDIQRNALGTAYAKMALDGQVASPLAGFLPIDLALSFNGTSGMKIFETYTVPAKFLPATYPNVLNFIAKKITHSINDKGWLTKLNSFSIPVPPDSITARTYLSNPGNLSLNYKDFNNNSSPTPQGEYSSTSSNTSTSTRVTGDRANKGGRIGYTDYILPDIFVFPIKGIKWNIGYDRFEKIYRNDTSVVDRSQPAWIGPADMQPTKIKHVSDFAIGGGDASHRAHGGHFGIDIFCPIGSDAPLVACSPGKIVETGYSGGPGNYVKLVEPNTNICYFYMHLDEPCKLAVGTQVQAGDFLGNAGKTGSAQRGYAHLHFNVQVGADGYHSKSINSFYWLLMLDRRIRKLNLQIDKSFLQSQIDDNKDKLLARNARLAGKGPAGVKYISPLTIPSNYNSA